MKSPLKLGLAVWFLMFRFLLVGTGDALAQDASSEISQATDQSDQTDATSQGQGPLASLSSEDKMKFLKARRQVLANNPDLKAEQDELAKERLSMKDASPDDKKAFRQKFMEHQKKMRDAMLQVDPSLAPIFDQLAQQMKQKFQQGGGTGSAN